MLFRASCLNFNDKLFWYAINLLSFMDLIVRGTRQASRGADGRELATIPLPERGDLNQGENTELHDEATQAPVPVRCRVTANKSNERADCDEPWKRFRLLRSEKHGDPIE